MPNLREACAESSGGGGSSSILVFDQKRATRTAVAMAPTDVAMAPVVGFSVGGVSVSAGVADFLSEPRSFSFLKASCCGWDPCGKSA